MNTLAWAIIIGWWVMVLWLVIKDFIEERRMRRAERLAMRAENAFFPRRYAGCYKRPQK